MSKSPFPHRVPAWASMLGEVGFKNFITLIEDYFASRNITINVDEHEGVIRPKLNAALQSSVFGLQNIAQVCHQAEATEWGQLISTHFDSIFNVSNEHNALTVDMSDFKKVQTRLRARLYPQDIASHTSEIVHRDGLAGTLEVLVMDLPTTVRTVSKQEAASWPFTEDELLFIGRRNLRHSGLLKASSVPLDQGTNLLLYSGDNFYAASHALIFEDYMAQHTEKFGKAVIYGAIVGIPKRDVMLVHFIHNVGAVEAIGSLLQAVIGMHRDGPGSITPNLYWYHDGKFEHLPYVLEGNTLNFAPPDEFVELLNELSSRANLS
jgi:hypothetical protein